MANKRVDTASAPAAIGPYSQAVVAGDWVFCSGQIAMDADTGSLIGGGDIRAETRQVFQNLDAVLAAAGATRGQVVKATVYLADMSEFSKMNEVYAEYFEGSAPPARACIQGGGLPKGARVEIDFIARLGDRPAGASSFQR